MWLGKERGQEAKLLTPSPWDFLHVCLVLCQGVRFSSAGRKRAGLQELAAPTPWALSPAHQPLQGPSNQQILSMALIVTAAFIITAASIVSYSFRRSECLRHAATISPQGQVLVSTVGSCRSAVSGMLWVRGLNTDSLLSQPCRRVPLPFFLFGVFISDNLHKSFGARQARVFWCLVRPQWDFTPCPSSSPWQQSICTKGCGFLQSLFSFGKSYSRSQ